MQYLYQKELIVFRNGLLVIQYLFHQISPLIIIVFYKFSPCCLHNLRKIPAIPLTYFKRVIESIHYVHRNRVPPRSTKAALFINEGWPLWRMPRALVSGNRVCQSQ